MKACGERKTRVNNDRLRTDLPIARKHILKGHRDNITKICFHKEFDVVISSSEDATVRVWDFESGSVENVLKGHTGSVKSVCFNPAGDMIGKIIIFPNSSIGI